jgi:hypothetical protein
MNEYLSDVIVQMKKALALVGNRSYPVPVYCVLLYSESDLYTLRSMGRITETFSMQKLAEEYFGVIIDDLVYEFGAEEIKGFEFIIRGAVEYNVETSTIIMMVDYRSAHTKKSDDLDKSAREQAYNYSQQKYLEDMVNRSAKQYLNS